MLGIQLFWAVSGQSSLSVLKRDYFTETSVPGLPCSLVRKRLRKTTRSGPIHHRYKDRPSSLVSMMVEGCAKGVKYGLFVANAVILIGGIVVFSVGIWTLSDRSFMERLLGSDLYVSSASILIATGIIVTIISFLGFLGAIKEIKCMLLTFFIILFMIFITMLVGGILGYVFRSEVDDRMYTEMLMTIKLYQNDSQVTDAWDAVQSIFQCCGMSMDKDPGYEVWSKRNAHFGGVYKIPATCCKPKDDGLRDRCQKDPNENNAYLEGCYEKMKDFVEKHAKIVGGIGVGIACLLLVGMALSCALFCLIK
ncbi:CD151 antigen [Nephila pilipes]|uniref:CD151 antigen n=1 Tax=Nephila pilipes TaxID=299642 RepID=A0A8X6TI15_NEPPI|nr:CD151 antigen [Nephila pilipes]